MSLKLHYYGQNDAVNCTPAVALYGDPGTDQQALLAAGYKGGVLVALTDTLTGYTGPGTGYAITSANEPAFGAIGNIVPADVDGTAGNIPFATLLNGPGEFAGAIGPSGSKKAPVVRAMWQGNVDADGFDAACAANGAHPAKVGQYLYCGGNTNSNQGKYTSFAGTSTAGQKIPVGICTHVPTTSEPWLGVASLL